MDTITKLKLHLKLLEIEPQYYDKQKQCRIRKKDRELDKKYENIKTFGPSNLPI